MLFRDLLKRADLKNLEEFVLNGCVYRGEISTQTYLERLRAAEENIHSLFAAQYTDTEECEKKKNYYYDQLEVFQDVYFEIGLLMGAKLAFQIHRRLEELAQPLPSPLTDSAADEKRQERKRGNGSI